MVRLFSFRKKIDLDSICDDCPHRMYRILAPTYLKCKHLLSEECCLKQYLEELDGHIVRKDAQPGDVVFFDDTIYVLTSNRHWIRVGQ